MDFLLTERSREIFRKIIEAYVETGEPVGSQTLSRSIGLKLSSATIRKIMGDLEDQGFLYSPHTSAGRIPTTAGFRFFVNGLLEIGTLTDDEKTNIESLCAHNGKTLQGALEEATLALSGLSQCAGVVLAPKKEESLKHIEFIPLNGSRVLVILVTMEGSVENRIIEVQRDLPMSTLTQASNYLNYKFSGCTLAHAKKLLFKERERDQEALDELTQKVVDLGVATWADTPTGGTLIVRGKANLLQDNFAPDHLSRLKGLFEQLETKEGLLSVLDATIEAEGIQIYIGSENSEANLENCSVILSPYTSVRGNVIGAIGVIGPTRLNYGRIIPMVDYTAKVISRLLGASE